MENGRYIKIEVFSTMPCPIFEMCLNWTKNQELSENSYHYFRMLRDI